MNGKKRSRYLPNAVKEAERARTGIAERGNVPFTVTSLLVFLCQELTVKERPSDVVVLRSKQLRRWLRRRRVVHRGADLWQLSHDVARWAKRLPSG